jgi:hypothetical protein
MDHSLYAVHKSKYVFMLDTNLKTPPLTFFAENSS